MLLEFLRNKMIGHDKLRNIAVSSQNSNTEKTKKNTFG